MTAKEYKLYVARLDAWDPYYRNSDSHKVYEQGREEEQNLIKEFANMNSVQKVRISGHPKFRHLDIKGF